MTRSGFSLLLVAATWLALFLSVEAFAPLSPSFGGIAAAAARRQNINVNMADADFEFTQESPEATRERIEALVENQPVLLFMKGSKLFPQCGFSNTAVQILQSFNIDFHTVDVLSDQAIREGIKDFSQWPTIPQLYVCGEFIGGSDIMIELYQSGELGEMIEKAKADMI